jgi:hypothetical protein
MLRTVVTNLLTVASPGRNKTTPAFPAAILSGQGHYDITLAINPVNTNRNNSRVDSTLMEIGIMVVKRFHKH